MRALLPRSTAAGAQAHRRQPAPLEAIQAKGKRADPGCACGGGCPRCQKKIPVQAKLAVSEPGDAFEQEADRIAGQVLHLQPAAISHDTKHAVGPAPRVTPLRSTASRKKAAPGEEPLAAEAPEPETAPSTGGQMLAPSVRAFFEPRFQRDLGHVRVHADARAARSARDFGALAYTAGAHIVFAAGQYEPQTPQGRHLLAHELVHTLQQSAHVDGGAAVIQRQVAQTGPSSAPTPTPCEQGISDTVDQALPWLQDAIGQLTAYEGAQRAVEAGGQATPDVTRVATALEYNFHTRSSGYAQLIRERLHVMEQRLSTRANLNLHCAAPNDPECSRVSFSQSVPAYTPQPGEVVFCDVGTPGSRPTETLIHELAHAVVPNLGALTPTPTLAQTPTDRAYEHQRLYHFQGTEEALDNAESYGLLVRHLVARQTTPTPPSYNDTMAGCADPVQVNAAVARAEDWNLIGERWMQTAVSVLAQPNTAMAPTDVARITPHFSATAAADLQRLEANYQAMVDSFRAGVNVRCAGASSSCGSGVLGWGRDKRVTDAAVGHAAHSGPDFFINLCPAWFLADEETRIRSIYALFVLSRPNHIVNDPQRNVLVQRDQTYHYVDLARELHAHERPPPRASSLEAHRLADFRVRLDEIQAQLDDIGRRLDALGVRIDQMRRDMDATRRQLDAAGRH
jgi:Domain of unknown function (DUF4157)